jgi:ubiquinone biosynthesis protein COQ9
MTADTALLTADTALLNADTAWLNGWAAHGWGAGVAVVAADAGLMPAQLLAAAGDRHDALAAFAARVDAAMRAAVPADGSVRDRLFDALMARFDALQQHRGAVLALIDSRDPAVALLVGARLLPSLRRLAAGAGMAPSPVLLAALLAIHARALNVWRSDTSADMAATMARLDQDLARAERQAERGFGLQQLWQPTFWRSPSSPPRV